MHVNNIKNSIILGDVFDELEKIEDSSIDMIFSDPPYFMQTSGSLIRVEGNEYKGVDDEWDKFDSYAEYDKFSLKWLSQCKRILKPNGTIFVIGSFHNIYRIGYLMQNLGFWVINDIIWNKSNPTPNFKGTRFTNSNETVLWCSKNKESKYTFNYKTMKHLNDGKQMKSVWDIPICNGNERIKDEHGVKVHNTQKPEELLYRIIVSSTKVGDIVLDPFSGTGTTSAVAKKTGRNYIGIDNNENYVKIANERINKIQPILDDVTNAVFDIKEPKVSIQTLLKSNYLSEGDVFYDKYKKYKAVLKLDGNLEYTDVNNITHTMSIHKLAKTIMNTESFNGWDFWFYENKDGSLGTINHFRELYRKEILKSNI